MSNDELLQCFDLLTVLLFVRPFFFSIWTISFVQNLKWSIQWWASRKTCAQDQNIYAFCSLIRIKTATGRLFAAFTHSNSYAASICVSYSFLFFSFLRIQVIAIQDWLKKPLLIHLQPEDKQDYLFPCKVFVLLLFFCGNARKLKIFSVATQNYCRVKGNGLFLTFSLHRTHTWPLALVLFTGEITKCTKLKKNRKFIFYIHFAVRF